MSLVHQDKSWLRVILILSLLMVITLMVVITAIRSSPATTSVRLSLNNFAETATALQGKTIVDPYLELSLRSDKSCYAINEPIQIWITLTNTSTKPITILKAINLLSGGVYYDVKPMVNGRYDRLTGTLGGAPFPPLSTDYVTLEPQEAITKYLPDFRETTLSLNPMQAVALGEYRLEIEYRNGIWGMIDKIGQNGKTIDVVVTDTGTWTGVMRSNSVTIRIVDKSHEGC